MNPSYHNDPTIMEIGVDESGRGPLFGRVYAAAVILPYPTTTNQLEDEDSEETFDYSLLREPKVAKETFDFDYSLLRDSKKFHSKKKIRQVAEYIKKHAVAWSVMYEDEKTIDRLNILQATQLAMRRAITQVVSGTTTSSGTGNNFFILVDGNYFTPLIINGTLIRHTTVVKGDSQVACIAAASILAKVERDTYIEELCVQHPDLITKYGLDKNMGYGTKRHYEGIALYGVTQWHRNWADKGGGVWSGGSRKKDVVCVIEDDGVI